MARLLSYICTYFDLEFEFESVFYAWPVVNDIELCYLNQVEFSIFR